MWWHWEKNNFIVVYWGVKLTLPSQGRTYTGSVREQGAEEIFSSELEIRGDWRKLRNEKRRDLYSSPGIVRVHLAGNVARIGGEGKGTQNVDGVT
jgi:hypothetical protein